MERVFYLFFFAFQDGQFGWALIPVRFINIIIKIIMEKSHPGPRPRYIEFRFEESLRKYQQPPRKFPKPNESICKNCSRKSCQSGRENRLLRLCETRRLYHATSRQKASQFSRRRQAIQLSNEKVSGPVSDFNCTENQGIPSVGPDGEKSGPSVSRDEGRRVGIDCGLMTWSIEVRETPIKEQVREELRVIASQPHQQQDKQKQREDNEANVAKVKDIDFHIGLVQELHHKINQYFRIENEEKSLQMYDEQPREQREGEKQPEIMGKGKICIEVSIREEIINESVNKEEQEEREENQEMKQENNQTQNPQIDAPEPQTQSPIADQPRRTGRIRILGPKGTCFLSARILNKLLTSNLSPNRVTSTVVRHHPYLDNISSLVQLLNQNNKQ